MNASDSVFGHYVQQGNLWEPLLSESSPLFQAIVNDDANTVEADLGTDSSKANQFYVLLYWGSRPANTTSSSSTEHPNQSEDGLKPAVSVKQRTLLMIAAFHGSMRVLALLAVNGADPATVSPDGLTAYQLAYSSHRPEAATVVAYLRDAEQSLQILRGQFESSGEIGGMTGTGSLSLDALPAGGVDLSNPQMRGMWNMNHSGGQGGDPFSQEGGMAYSTAELTKPEYCTDEFRMFCFKILRCCRRYAHDWRACPFAHPTENARRRDPREFKYCSLPCPDYKQGFCLRGDSCSYAHGVFECWLHPSKFRTQLCKDGNKCRRPVCFFAHSLMELRSPTYTWTPTPDALKNPPPVLQEQEKFEDPPRQSSDESNNCSPETNHYLQKTEVDGMSTELPPTMPPLKLEDSMERSPSQEGIPPPPPLTGGGGGKTEIISKKLQAAKTAGITPRMSNAFARKHGLNPKDGPTVNFQRLSGKQGGGGNTDGRPISAFDRRSQSFDSRSVSFNKSASFRQRRTKQTNHSVALDSLSFSMNSLNLSGRPGSRNSLTESSSLGLNTGPPPLATSAEPTASFGRGGLHHSHSTGEHLRSHSAILPDLTGSLDSSFTLLNNPGLGSASSILGLQNYVLGHSASYTPGNSFPAVYDDGRGFMQQHQHQQHHPGAFESVRSADFQHFQQHQAAVAAHAMRTANTHLEQNSENLSSR
eukprot:g4877.t1